MKIAVYLYNYIPNIIIVSNIDSSVINFNNSILNNTNINYFNLINYREYLYFKVYKCRVYIYILQNLQMQSQKIAKKIEKEVLIKYKNSLIYYI